LERGRASPTKCKTVLLGLKTKKRKAERFIELLILKERTVKSVLIGIGKVTGSTPVFPTTPTIGKLIDS